MLNIQLPLLQTFQTPSMAMRLLTLTILSLLLSSSSSSTFTISNNCPHPIWPATLAGAGTPQLPTTGLQLDPGQSIQLPAPVGWSGRIWARTGCLFDQDGTGSCQTGDCSGRLECDGMGGLPPATLFEITLGKGTNNDYYDVSLVDGYNLPMVASPRAIYSGGCSATGCTDLNSGCPKELQVEGGDGVTACKSACDEFGLDECCCRGEFANPSTCKPSIYSSIFKAACPRAYSYAFDDGTSTFTCRASDYTILFCPTFDWPTRKSNGFSSSQGGDDGHEKPQGGDDDHEKPQAVASSSSSQDGDDGHKNPQAVAAAASSSIRIIHLTLLVSVIFFV